MAAGSNPKESSRTEPRARWEFVNISSPVQSRDAAFKRLVRGNAMRNHRRNEKRNLVQDSSRVKLAVRDGRHLSPAGEGVQLYTDAPHASGEADWDEIVIRTDNDWWKRELHPLLEILEAALPLKATHQIVPRITNATEMPRYPSSAHYAFENSKPHSIDRSSEDSSLINSPQTYLDAGMGDPFGTCYASSHPQRQRLIHHCKYSACLIMRPPGDRLSDPVHLWLESTAKVAKQTPTTLIFTASCAEL